MALCVHFAHNSNINWTWHLSFVGLYTKKIIYIMLALIAIQGCATSGWLRRLYLAAPLMLPVLYFKHFIRG